MNLIFDEFALNDLFICPFFLLKVAMGKILNMKLIRAHLFTHHTHSHMKTNKFILILCLTHRVIQSSGPRF